MLFMVVEHFKDRDPAPVYKRFAEQGRLMPDGLSYVNSWNGSLFSGHGDRRPGSVAGVDKELRRSRGF